MNTDLEDYQSIKGKDPVFWFRDLQAICSFMCFYVECSFICNLSFTWSLARMSGQVKLILFGFMNMVVDGTSAGFFVFFKSNYSCGLSTATIEYSSLSVCLSVCVSVCLSVCRYVWVFVCLSVCLCTR